MSVPFIEPDGKHVLKALAWDSLRTALDLDAEINGTTMARSTAGIMDKILESTAETLSMPKTWGDKMARKFEHDTMYYCRACGHAAPKDEWERALPNYRKCPHCGGIFDISITNVVTDEPPVPEPEPEPKKPAAPKKK